MGRLGILLLSAALAGCVAGREGMVGGDGSVSGRDAAITPRDGSTAEPDGSVPRDAGRDRDGATPSDGSRPFFEIACDDGFDGDGDGLIDCADDDCADAPCDAAGGFCVGGICGGCTGASSETRCGDGADEDCDGFVDCADTDCASVVCGPDGVTCSGGVCPCPSGFVERACGDGVDDDCDSLIDCADPDCAGRVCAAGLICSSAGTCACGESVEFCNDRDEDCDGVIDDGCPEDLSLCCPSSAGGYGGTGGTAFSDPCPAGTMLIGIAGRAGVRIEQLQPVCAPLTLETDREGRPDFAYTARRGTPVLGATHGGSLGTAFDDRCPNDDVVIGVRGSGDELGSVDSIGLECGTVSVIRAGFSFRLVSTPSGATPTRGTPDATLFRADCANGAITGMSGRAGTRVDSVAFTCSRLQLETI